MEKKIVKENEQYMSDNQIKSQFSHTRIHGFHIEPARNFDGWTGYFDLEFPSADGIDYDTTMVNNFIAYDKNGDRIAWDNWMPDAQTQHLERIIRNKIAKMNNNTPVNENAKKNIININENQLRQIVTESVKRLLKENESTPQGDVIDYANKYGYDSLGYAVVQMIKGGEFFPDWDFAQNLYEYGGNNGM